MTRILQKFYFFILYYLFPVLHGQKERTIGGSHYLAGIFRSIITSAIRDITSHSVDILQPNSVPL
ncbi:MAG: hypothetical protein ACW98F_13505 [Candidatus Hodarchaeales archaeon]